MQHLIDGWRTYAANLLEWTVTVMLVVAATLLSCGVFWVFALPNLPVLGARAVERGGEPRFGDLLTLDGWLSRALVALVLAVGFGASSVLPVLGHVLWLAIVAWAPMLLAEPGVGPMEALQASWHGAKDRIVAMALVSALYLVLLSLSLGACGLPALFVWPWLLVSASVAYRDQRARLLAAGTAAGVLR